MQKPDISIVIPVYNRSNELRLTLQSLLSQTLPPDRFEVVIADDGSAEDIPRVLAEFPALNIVYCRQPDEGFRVSAARKMGAARATGRIVVFNDNGILLGANTLAKHIEHHDKAGESLLLLGYMHGTSYDSPQDHMRDILDAHAPDEAIAIMKREGGMGDGREGYMKRFGEDVNSWYIPWQALWGGHFSVNNHFAKSHGVEFDEGFSSWGGEDNEYGIQLCEAGATWLLARDVEVVHYPTPGAANRDVGSDRFRQEYMKVKQYIFSKHPTREVEGWLHIGSGILEPAQRAAFHREKGWEA